MADLNRVMLIGRLTRDAELKYTSGGMAVCKFSIAVNKFRKNGDQRVEEANFFDIVLWGRSGEALNQYLIKGKQVAVDGELHQNRWEQDGQPRSKIEIIATNVQLLGGSSGGNYSGGGYSSPQPMKPQSSPEDGWQRNNEQKPRDYQEMDSSPDSDFPDDIPF